MEKELFENNSNGAILSDCKNYRYNLWRIWDEAKPKVMFIMLNPSTADADINDPTIRRCIGFAKSWGFGGLYVGNIFAYRSTSPKELFRITDPFGEFNNYYLTEMATKCNLIICAWDNAPILKKLQYYPILDNIKIPLHCIELSKDGVPKHPLYLKSELKPIKYTIPKVVV